MAAPALRGDTLGRRPDPFDRLDDDAGGILDLEIALAPFLALDRREDRGPGGGQALALGIDAVDDEDDQRAVGGALGALARLERRQARPAVRRC